MKVVAWTERGRTGGSLAELLVAVGLLAVAAALLWQVRRAAPEPASGGVLSLEIGIEAFRRQAIARLAVPGEGDPRQLAGRQTLGPLGTIAVVYEGCLLPATLIREQPFSASEGSSMANRIVRETPADRLWAGDGLTGGVLQNEVFRGVLPGRAAVFVYTLTGSVGPEPQATRVYIAGGAERCR